jgi:hypothetical protein
MRKEPFVGRTVEERPRSPSPSPTYDGAMPSWRRLRIVSDGSHIVGADADAEAVR